MAERSLSDLNIELEAVNKSLDEQTVGQGRLIDAVEDLVELQRRNLDDLESRIEEKGDDAAPSAAPPPRGAGGGGSSGFNMPGMPIQRGYIAHDKNGNKSRWSSDLCRRCIFRQRGAGR